MLSLNHSFRQGQRWSKMKGKLDKYFYPSHRLQSDRLLTKQQEEGEFPRLSSIDRPYRKDDSKGQRETNTPFLTIFKMTVVYTLGGRQPPSSPRCLSSRNENVGLQRADGTPGT